jgi:nucleoside-diphosphate-sugar epimerase
MSLINQTGWRDARVLVTGARGFIGRKLCRRLLDSGALVHGVSRVSSPDVGTATRWLTVDLTHFQSVRQMLESVRPDVVFHLAGHVTGSQDLSNVQPAFHTNLASTVHLLTAAAEMQPLRIVLVGSMQEPDPDHPAAVPCSPYAASKWACSGYARMFHALYRLPVSVARPMMVYGPGQWDLVKLLPYVMVSLLGGTSPAVGSGTRELDWVYVDDVVDGMLAVATADGIQGEAVDLGSGTLTSIRQVIEHVATLIGSDVRVRFGVLPDRPLERPRAARTELTRRLIGWSAQTPLDVGLKQTVAWYRETWSSLKPA